METRKLEVLSVQQHLILTLSETEYIIIEAIASFSLNINVPPVGDMSEVAFITVQFTVTSPNSPRVL